MNFSNLPKWAEDRIDVLTRERNEAVEKLEYLKDRQKFREAGKIKWSLCESPSVRVTVRESDVDVRIYFKTKNEHESIAIVPIGADCIKFESRSFDENY